MSAGTVFLSSDTSWLNIMPCVMVQLKYLGLLSLGPAYQKPDPSNQSEFVLNKDTEIVILSWYDLNFNKMINKHTNLSSSFNKSCTQPLVTGRYTLEFSSRFLFGFSALKIIAFDHRLLLRTAG